MQEGRDGMTWEDAPLPDIDRRAFLLLGLGTLLGGCVGTYWSGRGEKPAPRPLAGADKPAEPPPPPDPPLRLATPIYEDEEHDWSPRLAPIGRRYWSLRAPRPSRLRLLGRAWRVTVHHEGAPAPNTDTEPTEVARCLRRIQKVHMDQHGAGDIGYHYIVDRAGRLWEGRSVRYQGAHAGGKANRGNVGVMLLGNFDIQQPSWKQKKTLHAFLTLLLGRYGLSGSSLLTHRELRPTRCPGDHLQRYVESFRPGL